jgi:hypothetical protein
MSRPRTWNERIHELSCAECRRRTEFRRFLSELVVVIEPEPTQEEIDAWLIPDDWSEEGA